MNVLHWHAVDAEAFPIKTESYPHLAEGNEYIVTAIHPLPEGAWAPEATYNATDIATVVQYALYRGIRVIPEFDTPGRLALIPAGHVGSWGKGYPSITTDCPKYSANVDNINLNPASNLTLQVVTGRASTLISRPLFRDVSCLSR